MDREKGFYWVRPLLAGTSKSAGEWDVMRFVGPHWNDTHIVGEIEERDLAVIGPRLLPPESLECGPGAGHVGIPLTARSHRTPGRLMFLLCPLSVCFRPFYGVTP